jgi:hypothetical protein
MYNTLKLLMMGIMVPETCRAKDKFCNKEPSVASSWPFYFHALTTVHGPNHVKMTYMLNNVIQTRYIGKLTYMLDALLKNCI